MRPFVTAGAGFLLAVLWFDLMFDVQVLRRPVSREEALDSIAAYYRRVTSAARPMSRLVAAVMLGTIAAIVVQIARGDGPGWAPWASLVLAGSAIGTAAAHTFPSAVLAGRTGGFNRPPRAAGARDPARPLGLPARDRRRSRDRARLRRLTLRLSRGGRSRTGDLVLPKHARYQAAPRPASASVRATRALAFVASPRSSVD
jgi:hypothetical protein